LRTEEWLRTRRARAEHLISEAQRRQVLDLGTLFSALREITDDPPGESLAEILAQALGCLQVGALLYLLHETRSEIVQQIDSGIYRVQERARNLSVEHRTEGNWETVTVESVREPANYRNVMVIRLSVILQALLWAIEVPPDDDRMIVY